LGTSLKLSNDDESDYQCDGLIKYLLTQGAFLNITFLVTTLIYTVFLVKMPPSTYYRYIFAGWATALAAVVGILWGVAPTMAPNLAFFVVSVAQVMPYYMFEYDFFVYTSTVSEKYYGFLYNILSVAYSFVTVVIGFILQYSVSDNTLFSMCIVILFILIVHSLYFGFRHKQTLKDANNVDIIQGTVIELKEYANAVTAEEGEKTVGQHQENQEKEDEENPGKALIVVFAGDLTNKLFV